MTHQFTNTNGEQFLAVGLNNKSSNFRVHEDIPTSLFYDIVTGYDGMDMFELPFPCQLIGESSELTEEQIIDMGLVEMLIGIGKDYLNSKIVDTFSLSPIEALQSRLKSFGFVLENEKVLILKRI